MQPQYYGAAADYNKPKGAGLFKGKFALIIGIAVVGLVIMTILFTVLGSIASGPRNEVARLTARTQTLLDIIDKDLGSIRDPSLKKISAETKLYLNTDILALQKAYGDKLPENIVASELDSTITTRLSDASKAGRHDLEFSDVMVEKVNALLELANKVKLETSGQLTRAAATQLANNLTVVSQQLSLIEL